MTPKPVTVHADAFVEVAIALMESRESQINSLVVTDRKEKNTCAHPKFSSRQALRAFIKIH